MAEAIIEKRKGISPVWILPLLAICLGGWLLFQSFYEAGIDITLRVEDSTGIIANKTPVMFKGNQVGIVKEIRLRKDLEGVDLIIEMVKSSEPYLVENLKFWVEKVDVRASRVSGLETLLSGSYIGVQPGTSNKSATSFVALKRRPPVPDNEPGLHLNLKAEKFNSLDIGSGVYSKSIEIGSVQAYELQNDESVLINIYIKPEYMHLVREGTKFWNTSGITISGGIANLKIHVTSLASLLIGGIGIQTPEFLEDSPPAKNGDTFTLYEDLDSLKAVAKPAGLHIILETDSLGSLKVGSSVYYRKVKVGEVTNTQLSPTFQKVLLDVTIYEPFMAIIRENTKFWNVSGVSVSGGVLSGLNISTESLEAMMAGGIALATPDNDQMGEEVAEGHHFPLEEKEDESWRKWSPEIGVEQELEKEQSKGEKSKK